MSNRLINESSPYLRQHAENPVNWHPWGEEALQESIAQDRPIFLSIGYAACHWCHVMEHESFENPGIAKILNDNFISIKVDREERPDLDQIYMNAVMALRGGGGGWPLSVFLTPHQEVFFGGTYWPPESRVGMPGFNQVLHSVLDAFHSRRDQVTEQSQKITRWLNTEEGVESEVVLSTQILKDAAQTFEQSFDYRNGGFGSAPKFPSPMSLQFLIRLARQPFDELPDFADSALKMAQISLKKMAYGGIFDHLGGGFARYSVDEKWLVPHFEKMLYDNGLLINAYLDMKLVTGEEFYGVIASKTLDYLLNSMRDDAGGFHATEDADSEGEEGKFYVWSKSQITEALGAERGELFCELYGVTENGNFEGQNILNMNTSYGEFAAQKGIAQEELRQQMRESRATLLALRDRRIHPGKDDKIIVSWNAMAISAMARAAGILNSPQYLEAATECATFLKENLTTTDGRLLHTWRQGTSKLNAYLDDYAFLINALVDLYEADFQVRWLDWAVELAEHLFKHFWDNQLGGFYFTSDDHEKLIARSKSFQDSAIPSGNSMAATALFRLAKLTGQPDWLERVEAILRNTTPLVQRAPLAVAQMLIALSMLKLESRELVLVANDDEAGRAALDLVRSLRPPNSQLVYSNGADETSCLANILNGKEIVDGQPTLYICRDFSCAQPAVGLDSIRRALAPLGSQQ